MFVLLDTILEETNYGQSNATHVLLICKGSARLFSQRNAFEIFSRGFVGLLEGAYISPKDGGWDLQTDVLSLWALLHINNESYSLSPYQQCVILVKQVFHHWIVFFFSENNVLRNCLHTLQNQMNSSI